MSCMRDIRRRKDEVLSFAAPQLNFECLVSGLRCFMASCISTHPSSVPLYHASEHTTLEHLTGLAL